MKTLCSIIVMAVITTSIFIASLDALNRSIYQGCSVVDQIGQTLIIELDALDPTDTGCEKAERLIGRIMADGYQVKIRVADGEWIPFPKLKEVR